MFARTNSAIRLSEPRGEDEGAVSDLRSGELPDATDESDGVEKGPGDDAGAGSDDSPPPRDDEDDSWRDHWIRSFGWLPPL